MVKTRIITIVLLCMAALSLASCGSEIEKPAAAGNSVQASGTNRTGTNEHKVPLQQYGLPGNFQENVFKHIEKLCSFGMRYAGSKSEKLTVDYIGKYFKQSGIETKAEKFKFQYFDSDNVTVTINGAVINCEKIWVNPYKNTRISGQGVLYDPNNPSKDTLKDKIVVVKNTMDYYQLLAFNTSAILSLNETDFERIKRSPNLAIDINVTGKKEELTSSNIIGSIYPVHSTNKEVIISAHWDSMKGPGASDNASGVGVLLELAKYYSSMKDSIPYTIRFVALGGEELGLTGAKAYVARHLDELENCMLLFNVDEVGGNRDIYIEMNGGVSKENNKLQSADTKILAWQDYKDRWLLNMLPYQECSNVPDWLKDDINKSCAELNYKILPGNGMGSDHQVFSQRGIPSTNICVDGDVKTHSPDDRPDKISLEALRKSGEIVASVINKTLNR